ncbi:hypothetical protein L1987_27809 [Smallanthus sonchifolius]|uniref:Uncharacterized protein n=1 Tax=Smallanthus sonchifolius TaxID=185202 RepID=A0ACB9IB13_9ASTR|nr:hypothetical protein L1987_27809 [Smallanthus sonchifolius]
MARPQAFDITNTMPPSMIMDHDQEPNHISNDYYNHDYDDIISHNGCGCFHLFSYFDTRHRNGETTSFIYHRSGDVLDNDGWLMNRFKDMKGFSEVVAGPKWKNFIRRFSKKPRKVNSPFQYDPESYALNFNDGGGDGGDDDDSLPCSFSTRFAPHSRSMAS